MHENASERRCFFYVSQETLGIRTDICEYPCPPSGFREAKGFNNNQEMLISYLRIDLLGLWNHSSVLCRGISKTILKNSDQWMSQEAKTLDEVQESPGRA